MIYLDIKYDKITFYFVGGEAVDFENATIIRDESDFPTRTRYVHLSMPNGVMGMVDMTKVTHVSGALTGFQGMVAHG